MPLLSDGVVKRTAVSLDIMQGALEHPPDAHVHNCKNDLLMS